MADIGFGINVDEAAAEYKSAFKVVPPGWYDVVIIESVLKPIKNGDGKYIEFKYEIQDGTRRTLIDRVNMINPNSKAQSIGRAQLGKIGQSIGVRGEIRNTDILHGRKFAVCVEVEKFNSNTDGKELESNKITDYKEAGAKGMVPTPAPAKEDGTTTSAMPKKPW